MGGMDLGVHLPLMSFRGEPLSAERVAATVDAAVVLEYAAVSANDHFVFQTPWLDGPTALASVIERSAGLELATTISLATLRGPVALAKQLAAIDILSGGRLTAALGPGSSRLDYDVIGVDFEQRWSRLDEAVVVTRSLLRGEPVPDGLTHHRIPPDTTLEPRSSHEVPLWIGSWGSDAGLRRVARLADGWLASAYNTTPSGFAAARSRLGEMLEQHDRPAAGFPNALATMWTWVDGEADAERMLTGVLAPLLRREPDDLRPYVCVGTPQHCAELLQAYAEAGCDRVYLWPLGDERSQLERIAAEVTPLL
jgi:alkanesulfonate monooxygenase SsuD/methylene tetrahydromethanopterin reductase-like flavin-dependent oxidoreductase (luciferase family)